MVSKLPLRSQSFVTTRAAYLESLIERYSPTRLATSQDTKPSLLPTSGTNVSRVVLLTGTTGNLGSDLLALLLKSPLVSKVYALNRASSLGSSRERIGEQFAEKAFPESLLDSGKCIFVDGKLTETKLGLKDEIYEELLREVNMVIHNAWPTSYAMPIAKFEPSLLGLQNLIQFARSISNSGKPPTRFIFVSSCSSSYFWGLYNRNQLVPEELLQDAKFAAGWGYAESKYVAEHMVARSGLDATSLRVSQLSGRDADGAWPPMEGIPMAFKFMTEINVIPVTLYTKLFPFIPLDVAAQCIAEISLSSQRFSSPVFNVSHPRPYEWSQFEAVMRKLVWGTRPLKLVSTDEWVGLILDSEDLGPIQKQLQKITKSERMFIPGHPGTMDEKAVDHFPAGAVSTTKAEALCATLRNLPRTSAKDQEKWVKYWIDLGLFEPAEDAQITSKL